MNQRYQVVVFGSSKSGLSTVGYQVFDQDDIAVGSRISTDIQDLNDGAYGALVSFPDDFIGHITWDTGEIVPFYASNAINSEDGTNIGDGAIEVNQDYGGTDNLTYIKENGDPISGAIIRVYLESDYEAGNKDVTFIIAATTTDTLGHWTHTLMLDPDDYTLIYYKQGYYGPDRHDITVS